MYEWAQNKMKLQRAIAWAREQERLPNGPKATEDVIKARYISIAGLVIEKPESVIEAPAEKVEKSKAGKKSEKVVDEK